MGPIVVGDGWSIGYPAQPGGWSAVSVTAYILIQAAVGCAADVARETSALSQVVTADVAMGPYDVIARASGVDMDEPVGCGERRRQDRGCRADPALPGRQSRSAVVFGEVWGLHVGFGSERGRGGSAVVVEFEVHPLALPQHAEERSVEGVVSEVDLGQVGLVDEDAVAGAGVIALDHTLHAAKRSPVKVLSATSGLYDPDAVSLSVLDAAALRQVVTVFRDALVDHREAVNNLNVYPVPDGDTGTNMSLTLRSGRRRARQGDADTARDMAAI